MDGDKESRDDGAHWRGHTEQRLLPDPIHYPPIAGFGVTRSRRPCNSESDVHYTAVSCF
jgi:hypothetical protein